MIAQNFIPNRVDIYDSDDSEIFEVGPMFTDEMDSDISESENSNENSEEDFDSTLSEVDSNEEEKDLEDDLPENIEKSTEAPGEKEGECETLAVDSGAESDDSGSSSVVEASMEDVFGVRPNREANRNHPPHVKTDVAILDLSFHPDADILAAASIDGDAILYKYSLEKVDETHRFSHHERTCRKVYIGDEGDTLITISKDKSWALVDLESSSVVNHIKDAHEAPLYSIDEINSRLVATGDDDGVVKVWDVRQAKHVGEFKCGDQTVTSLLSDLDEKYLCATVADGSLTAINLKRMKMEMQSEMYDSEFLCQCFIRGGQKAVVGTSSGMLYSFNWSEFSYHSDSFKGHPDAIHCSVPITDRIIVTGCEDGNIRALRFFDTKFLGVVGQHKGFGVESLSVSHDSNLLASCSLDEEILFWDIRYLHNPKIGAEGKRSKTGLTKNLPSSRRRNKRDFFHDFPQKLDSDDDGCGPVPGTSYDSG